METNTGFMIDGRKAEIISIKNTNGMRAELSDYGALLMKLYVPDQNKQLTNVVLGYDTPAEYRDGGCFFGAVVGRVANRIAGGSFELGGKTYGLTANENGNTLHGGRDFYHTRFWEIREREESKVCFYLKSEDMDQGFPGNLEIFVTYSITKDNELRIEYLAESDQDTIVNLTNHSYFNLDGQGTGDVLDQEVWIDADGFTPAGENLIPTGTVAHVEQTPMDFRTFQKIGKEIEANFQPLRTAGGYDHNMVLKKEGYRKAAAMRSLKTGILMEVFTDLPGMQFYTANFVKGEHGTGGSIYRERSGACFETQYFPDAVHHENFESPVLKAGERYHTVTSYRFSYKKL
ncbi:MAG: galactose mutarotase [Eubacterium sp.]|nr:galactose mutarotase [Eubacterium sp.]